MLLSSRQATQLCRKVCSFTLDSSLSICELFISQEMKMKSLNVPVLDRFTDCPDIFIGL